ncbi:MAG: glycosyltransferase [Nitriliruptor sp.]|nr:MAG: glycosyltransferase [Nitriliruptor sp.]
MNEPGTPGDPEAVVRRQAEEAASAARDALRRHDERWRTHLAAVEDAHSQDLAERDERLRRLQGTVRATQKAADRVGAAASAIVDSRRWALARRLGGLRDRLRPGLDPDRVERRLRDAVAALESVEEPTAPDGAMRTPPRTTVPETPAGAEPAGTRAPFTDHDGYLITATTQPVLPLPADEPTRRVLGTMDSLRHARLRAAAQHPAPAATHVTVVCTTHGPPDGAERALESGLGQHHPRVSVLLAGPGADALAASHHRNERAVVAVPGTEVLEEAAARSEALAGVHDGLVAHLDARTVWHEDLLGVLVHALVGDDGDSPAGLAYAAQELHAAGTDGVIRPVAVRFAPYHRALLENRSYVGLTTVVHHAALLHSCGGLDPGLGELAGWDLVLRLSAAHPVHAVDCLLSTATTTLPGTVADPVALTDLLEDDPQRPVPETLALLDARHLGEALTLESVTAVFGDHTPRAAVASLRRDGSPRPTTVVIPSYQAPAELTACLDALAAYSPPDTEVVVVDNASDADTLAVLEPRAADGSLRLLRNDRNLGFTAAVNRGIEAAGERDVVLLNNDAVVTPGWLEGLWHVLDQDLDAGLVVPRQVLPPGGRAARSHVPVTDLSREMDTNPSILHRNVLLPDPSLPSGLMALSFAPFFAVYVPRATVNSLGPLNVEHGPHYRSDRLYCAAVRHGLGRRIVYTPYSRIYHLRRRATKALRRKDPSLYAAMYERNDWDAIRGQTPA